jgi:Type I restriction modification DNA specificity domain
VSEQPSGWDTAALDKLVTFSIGGVWGSSPGNGDAEGEVMAAVMRGADFRNWTRDRASSAATRSIPRKALETRLLQEGDLVVEVSGGGPTQPVGRVVLIDRAALSSVSFPLVCSNFCRRAVLSHHVSPQYVAYQLLHKYASGDTNRFQTATTNIRNLSFHKYLSGTELAIAPRPEQGRIVAAIEEQFSRLDAGVAALERARQNLKRYRRAVLNAAVTGELSGNSKRRQHVRAAAGEHVDGAASLVTYFGGRDSKKGQMLPPGWQQTTLGSACDCLDSRRVPINKEERLRRQGTVPYYGANGLVGWIDDYLFDEPLVLVVEDETFTGREKPFAYKVAGKSWVNNHAHVLRAKPGLNVDYLNYALAYYPFTPLTTGTTGRKKLTKAALLAAPLALPGRSEQEHIVAEIERRLSVAEHLEAQVEFSLRHAPALRESVLSEAFSGKLVLQDLGDEPASALLERTADGIPSNGRSSRKPHQVRLLA